MRKSRRLAYGLQLAKIEGDSRYRREIEEILEKKFDSRQHLTIARDATRNRWRHFVFGWHFHRLMKRERF